MTKRARSRSAHSTTSLSHNVANLRDDFIASIEHLGDAQEPIVKALRESDRLPDSITDRRERDQIIDEAWGRFVERLRDSGAIEGAIRSATCSGRDSLSPRINAVVDEMLRLIAESSMQLSFLIDEIYPELKNLPWKSDTASDAELQVSSAEFDRRESEYLAVVAPRLRKAATDIFADAASEIAERQQS